MVIAHPVESFCTPRNLKLVIMSSSHVISTRICFPKLFNFFLTNDPTCLLKGCFTVRDKSLNFIISLASSCILYMFFTHTLRKKVCSLNAYKMTVGHVIKKCLATDKKTSAFICKELVKNKLMNLRCELSKC